MDQKVRMSEETREAGELEPEEGYNWYAINAYTGREKKVKTMIEKKMEGLDLNGEDPDQPIIKKIIIPTKETVEIKGGRKHVKEEKLFPGYMLLLMQENRSAFYEINRTQGVMGWLGGGTDTTTPSPLRLEEVRGMLGVTEEAQQEEPEAQVPFEVGEMVEIMEGPFSDFSGKVKEVFPEKGKVQVEVSLFGRPTKVEMDFTQVEAV